METADRAQSTSDTQLAQAARDGDEHAFLTLYERHCLLAWRTSVAITGDAHTAGTTLVEGFARAFTAIRADRVAADVTFRSLLLTSVRHAAIDIRRDRSADEATSAPFAHAIDDDDLETAVVAGAFGSLPERWRSVLWLTEVEGLRASQVAAVVGLVPNATATLTARARDGLREQYLRLHTARTDIRNCARAVSRLGAHAAGLLGASDTEKLERHLDLCDRCAERRGRLDDLATLLCLLTLPLPESLADEARTAWAAAVTEPAAGTGLSSAAEKILAGVSAFAAAVGVLGATMFGASDGTVGDERAATAIVTESDEGPPVARATPIELIDSTPISGIGGTAGPTTTPNRGSFGDVTGRSSNSGSSSGGGGSIVGASSPGGVSAPVRDVDRGGISEPRADEGTTPAPSTTSPPTTAAPAAEVGITVADQPVAVEVGEEPGLTVGPISVGSEPTPSEEPVSVAGPLAPLEPVVEPISRTIDETVSGLTGSLGL